MLVCPFCHVKKKFLPGSEPSSDRSGTLILDLKTCEKYLLFVSFPVCNILLLQPEWTKKRTINTIPKIPLFSIGKTSIGQGS